MNSVTRTPPPQMLLGDTSAMTWLVPQVTLVLSSTPEQRIGYIRTGYSRNLDYYGNVIVMVFSSAFCNLCSGIGIPSYT
ncbi:MAG: hypothetical protein AB8U44_04235 [Aaplasma endosymbiont of Hyalomma asiaticum]